jgi:hypothetical protein
MVIRQPILRRVSRHPRSLEVDCREAALELRVCLPCPNVTSPHAWFEAYRMAVTDGSLRLECWHVTAK